eukprot:TRINITY_DN6428_c0_g2_i2.p1 TRINITY_DN6428_c0_g2~~TRINITY_DN6428_c0_g2_i2.p1  ORF type:complete len:339 (+),score=56.97 TRINITY_DN6428_c0_g2_i2:57-1019(+)
MEIPIIPSVEEAEAQLAAALLAEQRAVAAAEEAREFVQFTSQAPVSPVLGSYPQNPVFNSAMGSSVHVGDAVWNSPLTGLRSISPPRARPVNQPILPSPPPPVQQVVLPSVAPTAPLLPVMYETADVVLEPMVPDLPVVTEVILPEPDYGIDEFPFMCPLSSAYTGVGSEVAMAAAAAADSAAVKSFLGSTMEQPETMAVSESLPDPITYPSEMDVRTSLTSFPRLTPQEPSVVVDMTDEDVRTMSATIPPPSDVQTALHKLATVLGCTPPKAKNETEKVEQLAKILFQEALMKNNPCAPPQHEQYPRYESPPPIPEHFL